MEIVVLFSLNSNIVIVSMKEYGELVIVSMKEDADDYAKRVGRTRGEAREENDRMVARLFDLEKA